MRISLQGRRPRPFILVMSNAALVTARPFMSPTHKRVMYMAHGPDATSACLLARDTEAAAIADGTRYFLRTRTQMDDGCWEITAF